MKYKESIALGVFIFSVLMIVVLLAFMFQGNLTGRVTGGNTEENIISCSDSDGKNYEIRGIVNYCNGGCSENEDSCSGRNVIEWYCENNEKKSEEHACEYDCNNGVCVQFVSEYKYVVTGSGGGGGGSSSTSSTSAAVPSQIYQTYNLGEISTQQTAEIIKGESIKFSINGAEYSFRLEDSNPSQATLSIVGVINVGEDKAVDLDSDGESDIYFRVESISVTTKKVELVISKII